MRRLFPFSLKFRPQFKLKTLLWLIVPITIVAAASRGSWLAVVLLYWGAAYWWAFKSG